MVFVGIVAYRVHTPARENFAHKVPIEEHVSGNPFNLKAFETKCGCLKNFNHCASGLRYICTAMHPGIVF